MLAGNHDHGLVAGWIDARLQSEPSGFLGLSEPVEPEQAGPLAMRLAELGGAGAAADRLPGRLAARRRLRASTATTSTCTRPSPTFERLAAGAMARWVVRLPEDGARPDDYEAALAPLYAFLHQLTQRSDHAAVSAGAGASARAWVAMAGRGARAIPSARPRSAPATSPRWRAINALGLGPVDRDLSGAALRRGGLRGIREVLRRLGIAAPHVIFGHTHRSGPWPRDDPAEWTTPAGSRLHNTGSWVYQPHFLSERAERVALLARHRGRRGRRRAAAAHPPAGRPRPPGAARRTSRRRDPG